MNIKKYLGILLASIISLSCIVFTSAPVMAASQVLSMEAKFRNSFSANNSAVAVHTGLVNTKAADIIDKVSAPASNISTLITPKANNNVVGLGHYNTPKLNIPLSELDYIRYRYYYDGAGFEGQRAKIVIKQSDFNMSRDCTVYSLEPVVSGKWAYLTFAVKDEIWGYILPNGILPEFEFYPFGDNAASTVASEKLYLDELAFWNAECVNAIKARSNGDLVHKSPVYFEPGRPDVSGTKPETIYAVLGETITLPECTFEKEGYVFNGWICSEGSVRMYPGDEYTLTSKGIDGGIIYNSARTYFVADWKSTNNSIQSLPSVNNVQFSQYSNGITDNRNYASYSKNVRFDGRNTVEFTFYPSNSDASTYNVNLDGWSWSNLPLDLAKYKYLIVLYYFETEGTTASFKPYINFLGGSDDRYALESAIKFDAKKNLSYNKWDIMCFEFDIMNKYSSYLKSSNNTMLAHMHFYPIGANRASKLSEGDKLYVSNFIFLDEIPNTNTTPTYNEGYLTGYEDGTFKPNGILTNAEAVSLVTKSMGLSQSALEEYDTSGYSDIDSDDWFFGSVAYLESVGALKPAANEKFNPNGEASRAEFIHLLVNLKSGDTNAAQMGNLSSSLSSGVLTRAEAVTYINNLYYDSTYSSSGGEFFTESPFTDVTPGQWFYPDIVLGASAAVTYKRADGSTVVTGIDQKNTADKDMLITDEQYAEALTYVEDLDKLTNKRIAEIRSTESEYKVGPGGTIYYISSTDGSESSPGTSEDNPRKVSTLNEVNNIVLNPGDVVLFKRGDTFRGNMTGTAGVTYSAYGDGDKPVFTRSPENGSGKSKWSLAYEDKATGAKIWKYYDETYVDVGAINLIDAYGEHFVAYKNIPDYKQISGNDVTDDADYIPGEENFWTRGGLGVIPFKVAEELDHDFEFVHLAQYAPDEDNPGKADYNKYNISSSGCPADGAVGPLYLRCDAGNPGQMYPRIEFNLKKTIFSASSNDITIDNICFKYFGSHGIGGGKNNLTVRNCEIGWGGGAIHQYNNGRVTRFGNGVEIYGGLVNYTIDNCYVYQIYDAGITHQISSSSDGNYYMEGVYYTNNVLTHSTYNIEYFMSINDSKNADGTILNRERFMKDVYFTDNILRYAGYGWGVQRPDNGPSNVKGWTHLNFVTNYVIEGNVFDRCVDLHNNNTDYLMQAGSTYESSTPYLVNNVFIQTPGRCIMYYGKKYVNCDLNAEEILNTIGGTGNKLYFYPDDYEDYTYMLFWRD